MKTLGNLLLILAMLSLLIVVGLKYAVGGWLPILTVMVVVASVSLVAAIGLNFKHYKALLYSDALQFIGRSFGFTVVVFTFLVGLNYLAFQNNKIVDLTPNKINSLSNFSSSSLEGLDSDIVFYFFRTESPAVRAEEATVRELMNNYTRKDARVKFKVVSIYKEPEVAKEFSVGDEASAFFASYKGRQKRLQVISEASVTRSILQLSRPEKVIYFLQSHGERSLIEEQSFGLSILKAELERLFYRVEPLKELDVPADGAFLAIVGPRMPYSGEDIEKIKEYLMNGGSLILAIDPGEAHNLAPLTKMFSVEFQNTFVFSEAGAGSSEHAVFVNGANKSHPLLKGLQANQRPLLFVASPLKIQSGAEGPWETRPLLYYDEQSESRVELKADSPTTDSGVQIAAAVSETTDDQTKKSRLFVIGDSDFLTNQFVSQHSNFSFIFSLVNYMSSDPDLLNIRPPQPKSTPLIMSQTDLNFYVLFFILPFPLIYFMIALFLKIRRVV